MKLALIVLSLLVFPGLGLAQAPVVPDPSNADALLGAIAEAVASGDYRWALVLSVIGLTAAVRAFGPRIPKIGSYLSSSRAGAITALVLSVLVVLAPAIAGKVGWSASLVRIALEVGFGAIGGWVGVRRLLGVASAETETAPAAEPPTPAT